MSRKFRWQHNVTPEENPVINHPIMQAQRYHMQLGQISALYPGAVHVRFHHCGYTGHIAGAVYDILARKGRHPGSRNDIVAGAYLHDGAHCAFSHGIGYLVEALTNTDHNKRIIALLNSDIKDAYGRTPRKAILDFGGDPDTVIRLLRDKPPISQVWSHKVVGADLLAYLLMDAEMTGFDQEPPDWERLIPYLTYFDSRGIGIEVNNSPRALENPLSMVCATQQFQFRMYTEIYHCPQSIALQRHIQKATELGINAGVIDPNKVWDIEDQKLIDLLKNGHDALNQELMARARATVQGYTNRQPFVPAGVFHYERFAKPGELPIDERYGVDFANAYNDPRNLTLLEEKLEKELGTPVLLALFPDPKKLEPKDLDIYSKNELVGTLKTECPDHVRALEEQAKRCFYIHVLAPEDEVMRLRKPANQDKIRGAFMEHSRPTVEEYRRTEKKRVA